MLQAAGLGDVTAQDIHEILPLDVVNELDAVGLSDVENNLGNLAGTTAITEDMIGDVGLGQAFDTSVLDNVANSGDVVQDVAGNLDVIDLGVGGIGNDLEF